MTGSIDEVAFEVLMTPEQREAYRQRKAKGIAALLKGNPGRPAGSNADEWHLYLSENKDALPMVAVQIAEAIEAAAASMWSEFVERCEALETSADQALEQPPLSVPADNREKWLQFYRGQRICAKSIRRSIDHPKYRRGNAT